MLQTNNNRRGFVKTVALGSLVTIANPISIFSSIENEAPNDKIKLSKNDVVVFQGDSITDAGRDKKNGQANNPTALGHGYAFLAAAELLKNHADENLQIYNKGVSGNKVVDLADRWQTDCLDLKPDVLSIFIGVNDYWHTLTLNYKGTIKIYTDDFRQLIDRTKQALPNVKLIVGEPFGLMGIKHVTTAWYPAFEEYRQNAKAIAQDYGAYFVPCQQIFDAALKTAPGIYWTEDGVHPTIAGNQLIAKAWLNAIK